MMAPRVAIAAGLLAVLLSMRGAAQTPDSAAKQHPAVDPSDSLYLRARGLVTGGNGAAGRALVDSALAGATVGTNDYATALYWRGALASTAADAERDYRRVIVEYPFSPHSGDALMALAQLEMARGDRDPAIDHLRRFLLQRPNDPDRVRAGIWLGRLLLEENQLSKGCAVLLRTRASLGDTAVETRNQVDYYASRCDGVDTTAPPPRAPRSDTTQARHKVSAPDTTTRRKVSPPDTATHHKVSSSAPPVHSAPPASVPSSAPSVHSAPSASAKRFTVQVAAYDTRQSAEQLVERLKGRGIVARLVESASAPYRVRIGHYATDADAAAAARELKDKGIVGFVTTTDNERARP
ncbi:MAG TPA: SPOR domain-containing protein [Gemmatimonadaceae bacterium]